MDANIIFGAVIDESLNDEIRLTVIATGFEQDNASAVTVEKRVEPKVEPVIKTEEPIEKPTSVDPLSNIDRDSVNIPSFLRARK